MVDEEKVVRGRLLAWGVIASRLMSVLVAIRLLVVPAIKRAGHVTSSIELR